MNITNKKVHHRQFGDGVVTGQTITTVTVQFSDEHGEKKFVYPSAFESFLTLNSTAMKEKMDAELRVIHEKQEEEAELRLEEEQNALLEQIQAAGKKRTSAKKAPSKPKAVPKNAKSADEGDGR